MTQVRRALLSVSDKRGIESLARALRGVGAEILSTGGTARTLREAGIECREVSAVTGAPEILGGRVKTLHPAVHAGLLAKRGDPSHAAELERHGIAPIDLVAVNLYPFEEVAARPDAEFAVAIENVDIGGPCMIRAAAKNHESVAVVVDPDDYPEVIEALQGGGVPLRLRRRLALKAFARTAAYDAAITRFLSGRPEFTGTEDCADSPPPSLSFLVPGRPRPLRYGENPHQRASFVPLRTASPPSLAEARVLQGKSLSYNNLLDADAALGLVLEFDDPACVLVKHTNPCGASVSDDAVAAFRGALAGDPVSAFGGIAAFNRPFDAAVAEVVAAEASFLECILAPDFEEGAAAVLRQRTRWGGNARLLAYGEPHRAAGWQARTVRGGVLVQERDVGGAEDPFEVVTSRGLPEGLLATARFAWLAAKHVQSNAIVIARETRLVGVGAGQSSRVDAVRIAVQKAGDEARGAVLASDAFFPFRDGVDLAADAGVAVVVQPGGSRRDDEVLAACEERGLVLVHTGVRHFRH